jgi:hypothetical protein
VKKKIFLLLFGFKKKESRVKVHLSLHPNKKIPIASLSGNFFLWWHPKGICSTIARWARKVSLAAEGILRFARVALALQKASLFNPSAHEPHFASQNSGVLISHFIQTKKSPSLRFLGIFFFGGAEGIRTPDPLRAKQVL